MLLDSNIIIYSFLAQYQHLLQAFVNNHNTCCSAVSCVETLGYHKLSNDEQYYLQRYFNTTSVLPVTQTIIEAAVQLRQQRKISLGDAIIAATALVHNQTLVTRNVKDFDWVDGLKVVDPFA